ncbi:hypothetical protein [Enterobacter cloacae complex sp. GF14B]|uniref:hypothetical protein n=1 Tax=Enterobacter cloacae complex sp. GF14B TaxID=2511982 RepID=UPI00100DF09A|nr:hypothetical protein [Enterobacter cloacae complex sp. GF14B]
MHAIIEDQSSSSKGHRTQMTVGEQAIALQITRKMMQQENQDVLNFLDFVSDSPILLYELPTKEAELPRFFPALYPQHSEPVDCKE